MAWENGVAGQTVHHGHLHLIPVTHVPGMIVAEPDAVLIKGWDEARQRFLQQGSYRYAETASARLLFPGRSQTVSRLWQELYAEWRLLLSGWDKALRSSSPIAICELERRWRVWSTHQDSRMALSGIRRVRQQRCPRDAEPGVVGRLVR